MFEINKFGEKFANFNNKSTNKFSTISGIKKIEFVSGPMLVSVEKELQSFPTLPLLHYHRFGGWGVGGGDLIFPPVIFYSESHKTMELEDDI